MEELSQLKVMRDLARGRLDQRRQAIEKQLVELSNSPDANLIKSLTQLINEIETTLKPANEAVNSNVNVSVEQSLTTNDSIEKIAKEALETAFSEQAQVPENTSQQSLSQVATAQINQEKPVEDRPNDLASIAAQLRENMARAGHQV